MEQSEGDHFIIQRGSASTNLELDQPMAEGQVMRLTFTPELRGVIWKTIEDSGNIILARAVAADDIQVRNKAEFIGKTILIHKREFSLEPVTRELALKLMALNAENIDNSYVDLKQIRTRLEQSRKVEQNGKV